MALFFLIMMKMAMQAKTALECYSRHWRDAMCVSAHHQQMPVILISLYR